ncbi:MAG TPA: hypothetical protein VLI92_05040 [Candidatus Saccharimonadales bacterium]|nr:hypothetical protein [Candidatus Saccharimonadales bacterium]
MQIDVVVFYPATAKSSRCKSVLDHIDEDEAKLLRGATHMNVNGQRRPIIMNQAVSKQQIVVGEPVSG